MRSSVSAITAPSQVAHVAIFPRFNFDLNDQRVTPIRRITLPRATLVKPLEWPLLPIRAGRGPASRVQRWRPKLRKWRREGRLARPSMQMQELGRGQLTLEQ